MPTNFDSLNPKSKAILLIFILSTIFSYFFLIIYFSLKIKILEQKLNLSKNKNSSQTISLAKPTPKTISSPTPKNQTPTPSPTPTSTPQITPIPEPSTAPEPEPEESNPENPDLILETEPTINPIAIATPNPISIADDPPIFSFFDQIFHFLPMKVTSVELDSASEESNLCPIAFLTHADITVNREGDVSYQWHRNTGAWGEPQTIHFDTAGTKTITHSWVIETNGDYFTQLEILEPNSLTSDRKLFISRCQ